MLEIGGQIRDTDYTKICENYVRKMDSGSGKLIKRPIKKCDIKEKLPSSDFIDNSDVPPLE